MGTEGIADRAAGANLAGAVPNAPSRGQVLALGLALIALAVLLAYLLASIWPSNLNPETKGSTEQNIQFLWTHQFDLRVSTDVQLLLMVMVAGALGSFVHAATSFADFVGNGNLERTWIWWYVLKPFIGMALAVVFYLVVRGGFLAAGAEAGKLNLYGIAALSGLSGMFSKQATDKLSEVFDALFRTAPGGGDSKRSGELGVSGNGAAKAPLNPPSGPRPRPGTDGEDPVDAGNVGVQLATPDEALPPTQGGVSQR